MGKLFFLFMTGGILLWGLPSAPAGAQGSPENASAAWNGTWIAQGTLFSVAVSVTEGVFKVDQEQSLGFAWSSQPGRVNGDQATLEVQYAGITARLRARLTGQDIAVVEALSCVPEFMVLCTLARGQQAVFVRKNPQPQ